MKYFDQIDFEILENHKLKNIHFQPYFFELLNVKIKSLMPENVMAEGSITLKSSIIKGNGERKANVETMQTIST